MSGDTNTYAIKRDMCGLKPVPNIKKEDTDFKHLSIRPDFSLPKDYDQRNPKSITLGNQIEKSCHTIHTEKTKTISVLMKHTEGGWPEAVKDFTEKREVEVWKRKIEKHPDQVFVKDVKNLIANSTEIIKKNLRMDVYEEYFEETEQAMTEDSFSAKIKAVFKDTEKYKRCVSKVTINLEDQTRIAVSYRLHKNQEVETNHRLPCLIWDINNPNEPINILTANSEITTVAFNPKHSHFFGAGCANGTAVIFDLTTNKILVTTKLDESHSEAICDFVWPKSKSWTEFVTTSTDGKTIWWDIKNLISGPGPAKETNTNPKDPKEAPLVTTIEAEKPLILVDEGKEYGGVKIEYNNEAGSNKYLIGTEQGTIFQANKKKNEAEIQYRFGFQKGKHLGPVLGMQRCPSIFKFFLTIGDWTARIWTEDFPRYPVFISKYHPAYLTDCIWSARPGLFFVSRNDGWINAYDLCYKMNEPTFSYKVCDSPLTSICLNSKGDKLIVGDEDGKIYIIKLSKSFYVQNDVDIKKEFLNNLFEREVTREKNIEAGAKKKVPAKDETAKLLKQEQTIKERIKKIDQDYADFITKIFDKASTSKKVPPEESKKIEENKESSNKILKEPKSVKEEKNQSIHEEKKDLNTSKVSKGDENTSQIKDSSLIADHLENKADEKENQQESEAKGEAVHEAAEI